MQNLYTIAAICVLTPVLSTSVQAAERATAAEAVAMVNKAVRLIATVGKEKAFAEFADPKNTDFHDRDLYIYVYDLNGVALTHGNNPKMIGKNLIDLKDMEGKPIIKEMVAVAKGAGGKGWVDFKWPNPVTKVIESKSGYVVRVDDILVGSGIYK